ncbi:hypothetical protein GCM10026982_41660 [Nocardiopsis aegyptia]
MDRVRDVAVAEGVRPTALKRQWIEVRLSRLEDQAPTVDQLESLSLLIQRAVREELEEAGLRSA